MASHWCRSVQLFIFLCTINFWTRWSFPLTLFAMKLKQSNTKNSDLSKCPSILMRINSMEGWRLCTLASFSLFAFLSVCAHLSHESKKPERNSLSLFLIVLEGDLRSIGSSSNIRAFLFFPFPPFATSVFPSAYHYHQGRLFASSPFQVLYFSILFFSFSFRSLQQKQK